MGPRDQDGYSHVPSATSSVGQEDVHAEESFLLSPSGTGIRTSTTTHNHQHRKGRWIQLCRNNCCFPRTGTRRRRKSCCCSSELRFRILGASIVILILGFIVAVSPIHYFDILQSSQDICGLEPDPIMRLKSSSTCKYIVATNGYVSPRRFGRMCVGMRKLAMSQQLTFCYLSYPRTFSCSGGTPRGSCRI